MARTNARLTYKCKQEGPTRRTNARVVVALLGGLLLVRLPLVRAHLPRLRLVGATYHSQLALSSDHL